MAREFFARGRAGEVVITEEYRKRFTNECAWREFEEVVQKAILQSAGQKIIENFFG